MERAPVFLEFNSCIKKRTATLLAACYAAHCVRQISNHNELQDALWPKAAHATEIINSNEMTVGQAEKAGPDDSNCDTRSDFGSESLWLK